MMLKEAIGGVLHVIRKDLDLTLRDVSAMTHISLAHLSEVERGKKQVSSELLDKIAEAYNMDLVELIGEIYEYLQDNA